MTTDELLKLLDDKINSQYIPRKSFEDVLNELQVSYEKLKYLGLYIITCRGSYVIVPFGDSEFSSDVIKYYKRRKITDTDLTNLEEYRKTIEKEMLVLKDIEKTQKIRKLYINKNALSSR